MNVIPDTRLPATFVIYVIITTTGSIPLLGDIIRQVVSASELTWFISEIVIKKTPNRFSPPPHPSDMGDLCRSCLYYLAYLPTKMLNMTWLSSLLIIRVPAKS